MRNSYKQREFDIDRGEFPESYNKFVKKNPYIELTLMMMVGQISSFAAFIKLQSIRRKTKS